MQFPFFIVLTLSTLFTASVFAQEPDPALEKSYSSIFGLSVGQGFESVENYLRDEFELSDEQISAYRMKDAALEAAQAVIEVSEASIPLVIREGGEKTMVPIEAIEIYFTIKTPLTEPPELIAHYLAFRFPDEGSISEDLLNYSSESYGEPTIESDEGPQWCLYPDDVGEACMSSCSGWDSTEPCPANPHVGFGEYYSGVLALTVIEWSAPANYKLAASSTK